LYEIYIYENYIGDEYDWDTDYSCLVADICLHGHLDCLKYAREKGCNIDERYYRFASYNNHIECVKWLFENGCSIPNNLTSLMNNQNSMDNIECIEFSYLHGSRDINNNYCKYACISGNIKQLQFGLEKEMVLPDEIINLAIINDHMECLKLLHEYGHPVNSDTFKIACQHGHLKSLQYLHNVGCPAHDKATLFVSEKGHRQCLKFLVENEYPIHPDTCHHAYKNGHLKCLRYAYRRDCPWLLCKSLIEECYSDNTYSTYTVFNRKVECFKYALEIGNTWILAIYKNMSKINNEKIRQHIIIHKLFKKN
jgi:hypothetical protein